MVKFVKNFSVYSYLTNILGGYCDKSFDSFCSSRTFHKSPDTHWVRILPHENLTFLVKKLKASPQRIQLLTPSPAALFLMFCNLSTNRLDYSNQFMMCLVFTNLFIYLRELFIIHYSFRLTQIG